MPPKTNSHSATDSPCDPRENIICLGHPADILTTIRGENQKQTQNQKATNPKQQQQQRNQHYYRKQDKPKGSSEGTMKSNSNAKKQGQRRTPTRKSNPVYSTPPSSSYRKQLNHREELSSEDFCQTTTTNNNNNSSNQFKNLQEHGMATALSIDHWDPPESSKCEYKTAPELSVNFICMHPQTPPKSQPDLQSSSTTAPPPPPPNKTTAARFQEIFVDMVGMYCASYDASSRHILDERFHTFLGKGERDFKNAVLDLMKNLRSNDDVRSTSAYDVLERQLKSKMGYRNTYFWSNRTNYKRLYSNSSFKDSKNTTTTTNNNNNNNNNNNGEDNNHTSGNTNPTNKNKSSRPGMDYAATAAAAEAALVQTPPTPPTITNNNSDDNHITTTMSSSLFGGSSTCSSATSSVILDSEDEDHQYQSQEQDGEMSNNNINNDNKIPTTSPTTMMMDPVQLKLERLDKSLHKVQQDFNLVRRLGFCGLHVSKEDLESMLRTCSVLLEDTEIEDLIELFLYHEDEDDILENKQHHDDDDNNDDSTTDNDENLHGKEQEEQQQQQHHHHHSTPTNPIYMELQQRFCKLLQIPGHVFVCTASVCDLHCDAFLCPGAISDRTDSIQGTIWKQWKSNTLNQNPWLKQKLSVPTSSSSSSCDNKQQQQQTKSHNVMVFQRYSKNHKNTKKHDNTQNTNVYHNSDKTYDRIVTYKHWPWKELADKETNVTQVPFFVGGEVSLEKSLARFANEKKDSYTSNNSHGNNTEQRNNNRERHNNNKNNGNNKKKKNHHRNKGKNKLPPEEEHIQALMETVRQFIAVSLDELRQNQPKPQAGRERYLLAIPVLGTGGGFAGDLTGQIVERLLHLLSDQVATEDDLDMVLVCADEATYAHAQTIRSNIVAASQQETEDEDLDHYGRNNDSVESPWSSPPSHLFPCFQWLSPKTRNYAQQLAESASSGHLALFLGAGVSMGSGLPSWLSLLHDMEDLFTPSGLPEERTLGESCNWDRLLMADKLEEMCAIRCDRHGKKMGLKKRICTYIHDRAQHPGLLLSLLTSLPCKSMVTQNYDRLIERSIECWNVADPFANKALSVIPYRPQRGAHHWLLKMHGCVTAPQDIIITGKDYNEFHDNPALAGLMQASLMTKHLLFVGFSLSDPNYLDTIDQVRHALHVPPSK